MLLSLPVPLQNVTLKYEGALVEEINGGLISINLFLNNALPIKATLILCEKVECPIKPGNYTGSLSQIVPFGFPEGDINGDITITNQSGRRILCINVAFKIAPPTEASSGSFFNMFSLGNAVNTDRALVAAAAAPLKDARLGPRLSGSVEVAMYCCAAAILALAAFVAFIDPRHRIKRFPLGWRLRFQVPRALNSLFGKDDRKIASRFEPLLTA
eukprot:GHVU01041045.1.p1 GENE.GHVU01041045.1~~GHVU01041045.1.p1  ORF type:complete len:214 (+),score=25.80 GHVU01041045.1:347-988(+)